MGGGAFSACPPSRSGANSARRRGPVGARPSPSGRRAPSALRLSSASTTRPSSQPAAPRRAPPAAAPACRRHGCGRAARARGAGAAGRRRRRPAPRVRCATRAASSSDARVVVVHDGSRDAQARARRGAGVRWPGRRRAAAGRRPGRRRAARAAMRVAVAAAPPRWGRVGSMLVLAGGRGRVIPGHARGDALVGSRRPLGRSAASWRLVRQSCCDGLHADASARERGCGEHARGAAADAHALTVEPMATGRGSGQRRRRGRRRGPARRARMPVRTAAST